MIKLYNSKATVNIDEGELVNYIFDTEELIHQKENPGWNSADTEMFPIIGPTEPNDFNVSTPKGDCFQDQHGLLRELNYSLVENSATIATFSKHYTANTLIPNSKYPKKSSVKEVSWPYDFKFTKRFELFEDRLVVSFEIVSEAGMPFMLGYHPTFMLNSNLDETCKTTSQEFSIDDVLNAGSKAYPVINSDKISLIKKKGRNIEITTKGFDNFMLWTEVSNMVCIEPITAYPHGAEKLLAKELFRVSNGIDRFEVAIKPF